MSIYGKLAVAALFMTSLSTATVAQDATAVIGAASKAMGADGLNSITYTGSAATGNFGQSRNIAGPLAVTTVTNYTRAIESDPARLTRNRRHDASRHSGRTAAAAGNLESEHHAGQRGVDAAARNLGHSGAF